MVTSTLTDKGQTTVPQEIREAMGAAPRQRLLWQARKDGTAVVRLLPSVMNLGGSLRSKVKFKSIREETEASSALWTDDPIKPAQR